MPLEIIGPGFGRTGTNSLKLALEHLGFGPCHHMFEVRDNLEQLPGWEAAARGDQAIVAQIFDDRMSDRDHAIRVFREHVAEVQSEIAAGRLLTFDPRDGWQPLCDFLEVEVPDSPFPRTNSSRQFVDQEWKQGQAQGHA